MGTLFGITDEGAYRVQAALLEKSQASSLISGLGEAPGLEEQEESLVASGLSSAVETEAKSEEIASKLSTVQSAEFGLALLEGVSEQSLISSFQNPGLGLSAETQTLFAQAPYVEREAATIDLFI